MSALHYRIENGPAALNCADAVRLCTSVFGQREYAWLELTMPASLYDGSTSTQPITVFIGATKVGSAWKAMNTTPPGYVSYQLTDQFTSVEAIQKFQKAITEDWKGFDSDRAGEWAKGTSLKKSMTSPSFVAKALKTGFDAISKPQAAYSGVKLTDWTIADLTKYAKSRQSVFQWRDKEMQAVPDIGSSFLELMPDPAYGKSEEEAIRNPDMNMPARDIDYVRSAKAAKHSGNFAYANELKTINLERVVGFGFRGEGRSPIKLKSEFAGALTPNYTRPDQGKKVEDALVEKISNSLDIIKTSKPQLHSTIEKRVGFAKTGRSDLQTARKQVIAAMLANPSTGGELRQLFAKEKPGMSPDFISGTGQMRSFGQINTGALDLAEYVQNEFLGGFISVSRSIMVAKSFACGRGGNMSERAGWVYACFVEGAFNMPLKGTHPLAKKQEFELAMPGMLDWEDVVGWRKVNINGKFEGPVYLRQSLHTSDSKAFQQLYQYFSGKKQ